MKTVAFTVKTPEMRKGDKLEQLILPGLEVIEFFFMLNSAKKENHPANTC